MVLIAGASRRMNIDIFSCPLRQRLRMRGKSGFLEHQKNGISSLCLRNLDVRQRCFAVGEGMEFWGRRDTGVFFHAMDCSERLDE